MDPDYRDESRGVACIVEQRTLQQLAGQGADAERYRTNFSGLPDTNSSPMTIR